MRQLCDTIVVWLGRGKEKYDSSEILLREKAEVMSFRKWGGAGSLNGQFHWIILL